MVEETEMDKIKVRTGRRPMMYEEQIKTTQKANPLKGEENQPHITCTRKTWYWTDKTNHVLDTWDDKKWTWQKSQKTEVLMDYLKKRGKKSQDSIAGTKRGILEETNEYWLEEGKKDANLVKRRRDFWKIITLCSL